MVDLALKPPTKDISTNIQVIPAQIVKESLQSICIKYGKRFQDSQNDVAVSTDYYNKKFTALNFVQEDEVVIITSFALSYQTDGLGSYSALPSMYITTGSSDDIIIEFYFIGSSTEQTASKVFNPIIPIILYKGEEVHIVTSGGSGGSIAISGQISGYILKKIYLQNII